MTLDVPIDDQIALSIKHIRNHHYSVNSRVRKL